MRLRPNMEQSLNIIYAVMAVGIGFLSISLSSIMAAAVGIGVYAASFAALKIRIKTKKTKWLVMNSLITYLLIWILTWTFLFNTG